MVNSFQMNDTPVAEKIRLLYVAGKSPVEIAAELGVARAYTYKVLGFVTSRRSMEGKLAEILREIRELRSEIRNLTGAPKNVILKRIH